MTVIRAGVAGLIATAGLMVGAATPAAAVVTPQHRPFGEQSPSCMHKPKPFGHGIRCRGVQPGHNDQGQNDQGQDNQD